MLQMYNIIKINLVTHTKKKKKKEEEHIKDGERWIEEGQDILKHRLQKRT